MLNGHMKILFLKIGTSNILLLIFISLRIICHGFVKKLDTG